jgi:hypothetical protein
MPRETSIVDSIKRHALAYPGMVLLKRHGDAGSVDGHPDLSGCFLGLHLEVEVKRPGQEPRPLQLARLAEWRRAGAIVMVCHSAEEFDLEMRRYFPDAF